MYCKLPADKVTGLMVKGYKIHLICYICGSSFKKEIQI